MMNKRKINNYKIIKPISKTTNTRILKVIDNRQVHQLTIKQLHPNQPYLINSNRDNAERLLSKCKKYTSINHKNI